MTELIEEVLPGHPVGVLTGPNLAREIMTGQAAASVLSMEDEIVVRALQPVFHSGLFRVYTNTDLLGCELGGVLKNIIAIAVGMRSEEHTSELQSLMRISYAVFCLKKKIKKNTITDNCENRKE